MYHTHGGVRRIDSTDVALPTSDGRTLKIRCVVAFLIRPKPLCSIAWAWNYQRLRPLGGMGQM
jgi:hypothetical protein